MLAHSASSLHAGAFAPYARRTTSAADALSDALTALARREVQLSALLDIARALEQDLKQARTPPAAAFACRVRSRMRRQGQRARSRILLVQRAAVRAALLRVARHAHAAVRVYCG
jgi:hypothetical protein